MNGLFPPSAPCPLWDRALSVSRWGHRTLRGAIFSHCLRRGAHRAPAVPREWPQFLRRGGSQTRPPHRCEAGGRKPPHPSQHTPCHLPPSGGKALGRLEAAPAGCLRSLRRGAHRAPAGLPPAAPILPGQARSPRGVCPPIQHTRGGSTNGGIGCGPPPAPDAGAMPKARVSRIGGPGESGLRDSGGTHVEPWSRRERHPAALCLLCRRGQSRPPRRAESLGGGDGGMEGRPLIRHGIRRDTFPPVGGRL